MAPRDLFQVFGVATTLDASTVPDAPPAAPAAPRDLFANPPDGIPVQLDKNRGAPASVRQQVGSAYTPEDRLATIRKTYPDAQPYGDDNFIFTDPKTKRPTLYNPPGFDFGDVPSVGGEVAEMAGGTLAGALAVPPAIAGAVPSGGASLLTVPAAIGLGAAGARQLYDIGARANGTVDTRSVAKQTTDAAVTGGTNAIGARAADLVGQGVRAISGPVQRAFAGLNPARALPDANLLNVRPMAGTVTGNRAVQMVEQGLANTPGGAGVMQRAAEQGMADLDAAAGRVVDDMASGAGNAPTPVASTTAPWRRALGLQTPRVAQPGNVAATGRPMSEQGAGGVAREGAARAGQRFATRREGLDDALMAEIGPQRVVPVNNVSALENEMTGYLNQAFNSRNPEFRGALEELRSVLHDAGMLQVGQNGNVVQINRGQGGLPFEVLRSIRSRIGRDLERPDVSGYTPSTEAAMRRVYGALSEDIRAAADATSPRARQLLNLHDRYVRFNRNVNLPALQKIEDAGTDEAAFKVLMSGAKDGGTTLARIRRSLQPEEWDAVASSVMSKLGRAKPGQQTASGVDEAANDFSAATLMTNWSALPQETKVALFGGSRYRDLVPELDALVRISGRVKDAQQMANPSGTARNLMLATGVGAAGMAAINGDPKSALGVLAGTVLAPRVAAHLITNPQFVRWLGQTTTAVARQPAAWGTRVGQLVAIAKAEPEIRDEVYQYLDALRAAGTESPQGTSAEHTAP